MSAEKMERSPALAGWLVLLLVSNGIAAIVYSFLWLFIKIYDPAKGGWALPALAFVSLLGVFFIAAIYKWKKWGMYGFAFTTLVSLGINTQIGVSTLSAALGLVGVAVLWYFIRPYWNYMK